MVTWTAMCDKVRPIPSTVVWVDMDFPPNQGLDQEEVDEQVESVLADNDVVLFMKGRN